MKQDEHYSVSGLADELGVDRRTVRRRLKSQGVEPVAESKQGHPRYRLEDAERAIEAEESGVNNRRSSWGRRLGGLPPRLVEFLRDFEMASTGFEYDAADVQQTMGISSEQFEALVALGLPYYFAGKSRAKKARRFQSAHVHRYYLLLAWELRDRGATDADVKDIAGMRERAGPR